ncbi:hypothetical protein TNCV_2666471 [Trichonephila clavipes]|nr:hypothetical protein TNCV_2666471 [Trichonephila clavipes]
MLAPPRRVTAPPRGTPHSLRNTGLETRDGRIRQSYSGYQLSICQRELISIEENSNFDTTLRSVATAQSCGTGQGFKKYSCEIKKKMCNSKKSQTRKTFRKDKISLEACLDIAAALPSGLYVQGATPAALNGSEPELVEPACRFQGRRFQSADEVKSTSHAELKSMAKNERKKCFDELYKR